MNDGQPTRKVPTCVSLCDACLKDYRNLTYDSALVFVPNAIPLGDIIWMDEHPFIDGTFGPYARHRGSNGGHCLGNAQLIVACRSRIWLDGRLEPAFQPYWANLKTVLPDWPGFQRLNLPDVILALPDADHRRLPTHMWKQAGLRCTICPDCSHPTKSPWGQQCLECGADWHEIA